jgi:hypothetical protein
MIRFLQPPSEAISGAMKSMHHSHERLQMTQADGSRVKNMRHIDSNKVQLYAVRMFSNLHVMQEQAFQRLHAFNRDEQVASESKTETNVVLVSMN